jgi:hypothetical protein
MTATLASVTRTAGTCDCCDRAITTGYNLTDGRTLGRKCASKALGWAATAVEREAKRLERLANRDERRRAAGWTVERFVTEMTGAIAPQGHWAYADNGARYMEWVREIAEEAHRKLWAE